MLLIFHITVALTGLFYTAYVIFQPSKKRLNGSYVLVALTFVSGFYLVFTKPAHMLQVCTEGLVYLGAMFAGIIVIRRKIFKQDNARHSLV